MTAMAVLVSSDVIAFTADGRKIVRTVMTASDTQTGSVSFQIDKIKKFHNPTSGFCGFIVSDTSGTGLTTIVPVVLSGTDVTNAIAVAPSGNSTGMVIRFLSFEGGE